jgi:hypothetical protein
MQFGVVVVLGLTSHTPISKQTYCFMHYKHFNALLRLVVKIYFALFMRKQKVVESVSCNTYKLFRKLYF